MAELQDKVQIDYEMLAGSADGVPVIHIIVEDPTSDYTSVVQPITEAVSAFDGELWLIFSRRMEMTVAEKAAGMKDPQEILAHFDAKTGQRIP